MPGHWKQLPCECPLRCRGREQGQGRQVSYELAEMNFRRRKKARWWPKRGSGTGLLPVHYLKIKKE